MHTFDPILALTLIGSLGMLARDAGAAETPAATAPLPAGVVALPRPDLAGHVTLERAMGQRRSVREFAPGALTLAEAGQLAWAAQGITSADCKRTTPSARAVYPLVVYLVANDVGGLANGVYRYEPKAHALTPVSPGSHVAALAAATPSEPFIAPAPLLIVVAGDSVLAAHKFGPHFDRWSAMETGFVVQDVYLQATAMGLGTVMVGGFDDAALRRAVSLPEGQVPYALMPVGRRPER